MNEVLSINVCVPAKILSVEFQYLIKSRTINAPASAKMLELVEHLAPGVEQLMIDLVTREVKEQRGYDNLKITSIEDSDKEILNAIVAELKPCLYGRLKRVKK